MRSRLSTVGLTRECALVCFRCVPVCGADLFSGPAVHVHVHCDGNLPVHTEEAEVKRLAATSTQPSINNHCLLTSYYVSKCVISLQTTTIWSKAPKIGKIVGRHGFTLQKINNNNNNCIKLSAQERQSPVWSACLLLSLKRSGGTGRKGAESTKRRYHQRYLQKVKSVMHSHAQFS